MTDTNAITPGKAADAGPMPDSLKRAEPDYSDLSATDLAKQINADYAVILAGERKTLQLALPIGEKLAALRARAKHGEWKTKLAKWCPNLSYETATVYIRLWEERAVWEARARAKNVEPTDLTIEGARKLLAKSRSDDSDDSDEADDAGDDEDGVASPGADTIVADLELDAGDMFEVLKAIYDRDDLLDITKRLATHLGMTLVPRPPTPTTNVGAVPAVAAPVERRV
jgi:hypothetical protein